jgi:hypothetical protein
MMAPHMAPIGAGRHKTQNLASTGEPERRTHLLHQRSLPDANHSAWSRRRGNSRVSVDMAPAGWRVGGGGHKIGSSADWQNVHRALAEATDPADVPDRCVA